MHVVVGGTAGKLAVLLPVCCQLRLFFTKHVTRFKMSLVTANKNYKKIEYMEDTLCYTLDIISAPRSIVTRLI